MKVTRLRTFALASASSAFSLWPRNMGSAIAARIPITRITTRSSMSVNPRSSRPSCGSILRFTAGPPSGCAGWSWLGWHLGGLAPRAPWLCVPASRRVCPYTRRSCWADRPCARGPLTGFGAGGRLGEPALEGGRVLVGRVGVGEVTGAQRLAELAGEGKREERRVPAGLFLVHARELGRRADLGARGVEACVSRLAGRGLDCAPRRRVHVDRL